VALITNPTAGHLAAATQAARMGMHLFIEKPLSHSLAEVEPLLALVKKQQLITYVGCQLRFDPLIRKLKDGIERKDIFYARICCSSYLPDWRPDRDYREVYSSRRDLGGGVLLDLIHELDYAHWLLGDIVHIGGEAGRISPLMIDTEDYADLLVHHAGGIRSHIHLDYFGRRTQRKIELFGEEMTLEADLISRALTRSNGVSRTSEVVACADRDIPLRNQLRYFFDCLDRQTDPLNNIFEHLKVLEPLLQFKRMQGL
jgi:predicted dehydrogenase